MRAATSIGRLKFADGTPTGNFDVQPYVPGKNCPAWTQEFALKALRWERRMEFAMEGDRFFDLVRWGIAAETMNSYISVEQNKRVYYRGARFVRGRDEYLPIPNAQYNFSEGNYVQNPGYGKFN